MHRITHLPTKIVVQCQNERSQHKNKETCYKKWKQDLRVRNSKKRRSKKKELNEKTDIGWGHQIRSYILQPYQLVKDLRNKIENTNPASVLDGNIDQFIEEGLKIKWLKKFYKSYHNSFLLVVLVIILSTTGITTDRFNKLISYKVEKEKNIKLELKIINFKLDPKKLSLFLETQQPKINYRDLIIPVQNAQVYIDFLPLLKTNLSINKIYLVLDELDISEINKFSKFIKPSNFKNFLNNKIQKGKLISEIEIFFKKNSINTFIKVK